MLSADHCRARRLRIVEALNLNETLWLSHPDTLRYLAGFHVRPTCIRL
jgi:hypothetical protein